MKQFLFIISIIIASYLKINSYIYQKDHLSNYNIKIRNNIIQKDENKNLIPDNIDNILKQNNDSLVKKYVKNKVRTLFLNLKVKNSKDLNLVNNLSEMVQRCNKEKIKDKKNYPQLYSDLMKKSHTLNKKLEKNETYRIMKQQHNLNIKYFKKNEKNGDTFTCRLYDDYKLWPFMDSYH